MVVVLLLLKVNSILHDSGAVASYEMSHKKDPHAHRATSMSNSKINGRTTKIKMTPKISLTQKVMTTPKMRMKTIFIFEMVINFGVISILLLV